MKLAQWQHKPYQWDCRPKAHGVVIRVRLVEGGQLWAGYKMIKYSRLVRPENRRGVLERAIRQLQSQLIREIL